MLLQGLDARVPAILEAARKRCEVLNARTLSPTTREIAVTLSIALAS